MRLIYSIIDHFRKTDSLKAYQYLRKAQWNSPEEISETQRQALNKLLIHCNENVPYYRNLFKEHGYQPSMDQPLSSIQLLPILEKSTIRDNSELFEARSIEQYEPRINTTGGTTKLTLHHYISRVAHSSSIAYNMLELEEAGYRFGDRMFLLGGSSLLPSLGNTKGWLYNRLRNIYLLSSFNLSPQKLDKYAEKISNSGAEFLRGYASSIYTLSRHILQNELDVPKMKAIFTTAETLYPEHREVIEEAFKCPVFNEYGARDGGVFAFECSRHEGLHLNALNCLVEVVNDKGDMVPNGESGQLVLTSLDNYAFPFVRYRVGDMGILAKELCSCGRGLPLLKKIIGRSGDYILGDNGVKLHNTLFLYIFWQYPSIVQYQVIQTKQSHITIKYVEDIDGLSKHDLEKIHNEIIRHAGSDMNIDLKCVNSIPDAPSGKWRYVISNLKQ